MYPYYASSHACGYSSGLKLVSSMHFFIVPSVQIMYSPALYISCAPVGCSHGRAYSFFRLCQGFHKVAVSIVQSDCTEPSYSDYFQYQLFSSLSPQIIKLLASLLNDFYKFFVYHTMRFSMFQWLQIYTYTIHFWNFHPTPATICL